MKGERIAQGKEAKTDGMEKKYAKIISTARTTAAKKNDNKRFCYESNYSYLLFNKHNCISPLGYSSKCISSMQSQKAK